MRIRKLNDEVIYTEDQIVKVKSFDIQWLKQQADCNLRKKARFCTHLNTEDLLHEMLIVHSKNTYVRPHKHLGKPESFHVIEGTVDVIMFDENGDIREVIQMGNYGSDRVFYYRIATPIYHTLLIRSDVLVFHETTTGPFNRADTVFAPWSLEESDCVGCALFTEKLLLMVEKFSNMEAG